MANIKLRTTTSATDPGSTSAKGSALSHAEMDSNLLLINTEISNNYTDYTTFKAKYDTTVYVAGNDGQLLYWDNTAGTVKVKALTTADVTENASYLYYTDARADARINTLVTKSFVDTLYASAYIQGNFQVQTSDYNALSAINYMVDTTGGVVTATLPASPAAGDTIRFTNGAENFATNNLVINRNGNTIDGAASNVTLSSNPSNGILTLIYDGTTWRQR